MCVNNGKPLTAGCARGTIETRMMGYRLCPQPNAFNKSRCTAGGIRAVQRLFAGKWANERVPAGPPSLADGGGGGGGRRCGRRLWWQMVRRMEGAQTVRRTAVRQTVRRTVVADDGVADDGAADYGGGRRCSIRRWRQFISPAPPASGTACGTLWAGCPSAG